MEEIFIQLAFILFIAFVASYVVRLFKQPIIIGYIIAGIIVSPFILMTGVTNNIILIFSDLGIAFLLFIVGLHLNPKIIKEIGIASLLIGGAQIIFTFALGFIVSIFVLGYDIIPSAYIALALAFSSTIIIMKLLSDKGKLDSLPGKISIGILIIQDLVAIAALMFVSSFSNGGNFSSFAMQSILTGAGLLLVTSIVGFFIIPRIIKSVAKSQELLFLFSICWCFVVAALFSYFGFSLEIGALIAGVVLSVSPYSIEISAKIRPLRDFFLIIFFIILGLNMSIDKISTIIYPALILSLTVLIGKPLILMTLSALFGYTKRTNFLVGTSLAQISEFSIILLTLGLAINHIEKEVLSIVALTLVITIIVSSYMISYSGALYDKVSGWISIFERKIVRKQKKKKGHYDAILFGYNRIGFSILRSLKKIGKKYLVVDFNPDVISNLEKYKIPALYGDSYDADLLEDLPLDKIHLAISTIPDFETNTLLIESIRMKNDKAIIIVRAHQIEEALELYEKGASYVLTPHFLGGEYVAKMITELEVKKMGYRKEKDKHIKMLKERLSRGDIHPAVEKN
jgi:Kef-type K+ transport system membrane component KefB